MTTTREMLLWATVGLSIVIAAVFTVGRWGSATVAAIAATVIVLVACLAVFAWFARVARRSRRDVEDAVGRLARVRNHESGRRTPES